MLTDKNQILQAMQAGQKKCHIQTQLLNTH